MKVLTGSTNETDLAGDRLEAEHQPGTSSWDPLLGVAAQNSWSAVAVHGSALCQFSTDGEQDTRLGDRINVSGALAYTLGNSKRHEHRDGAHGFRVVMLEGQFEHKGRQRIAGTVEGESGGEVLWLAPGLRYTGSQGWSAALSAGLPVWQNIGPSHPENGFRVITQVGYSF